MKLLPTQPVQPLLLQGVVPVQGQALPVASVAFHEVVVSPILQPAQGPLKDRPPTYGSPWFGVLSEFTEAAFATIV